MLQVQMHLQSVGSGNYNETAQENLGYTKHTCVLLGNCVELGLQERLQISVCP